MCLEVVDDLQGIEDMTLNTERERLKTLQEDPCVERRDAGTLIAEQQGTDTGHERSGELTEDEAVVRRVGIGEAGELIVLEVIELATVDDDTTEAGSVTANELCSAMHHDISSVLDRTNEVRGTECVVDNQWDAVTVCDLSRALDIRNVRVRVAKGLDIHEFCIWLDGSLERIVVVGVDECRVDAVLRQGMLQQVVTDGTATQYLGGKSYTVAGKTGTAEYDNSGNCNSWFVGFSNVDNPDIVISVVVEDYTTNQTSGTYVASKVFDAYYGNVTE